MVAGEEGDLRISFVASLPEHQPIRHDRLPWSIPLAGFPMEGDKD